MADGKIRGAFNDEQFEAFCQELQALPEKQRTLKGIAAFFEARTGIVASHEAAKTFKQGPWARYIERLNSGRQAREQLCAAVGAGAHPVDAMEDMIAIELQDHFTGAEGGEINIKFVIDQLTKLRTSISMRENSRRQQQDLERKQKETEAKLEIAEQREKLLREQVQSFERDRTEWEEKRRQVTAQLDRAKNAPAATADDVRAAAVAEIDRIMGIPSKAKK